MTMPYARDPISEVWDQAAADVLRRAVAARGAWVESRIKDWTGGQRAELLAAYGIDVAGPDDAPGGAARSRWARAFVRAVYAANRREKRKRSIQLEVGRRVPARGVIPAGRIFRIRTRPGGQRARAYMERKQAKAFGAEGELGPRWADPERRDWSE